MNRSEILESIKDLTPVHEGNSLHCWNAIYDLNGTKIELLGSISSKEYSIYVNDEEID